MRSLKILIVLPFLVLLAASCAPHHHGMMHHDGMMGGPCGPESCMYRGRCFSGGAVQDNGGVCQSCNAGRWVAASGCSSPCGGGGGCCHHGDHDGPCHKCDKGGEKSGKKPCGGGGASHAPKS